MDLLNCALIINTSAYLPECGTDAKGTRHPSESSLCNLRATSPSSNLNYPADNPPSSADSSSSPTDWPQQQHHHLNSTNDISFLPHLNGSDYFKPPAQLPGVQNLLNNNHSHSSCF
ncbi:hypothetical protein MJO28_003059 [Puccinia striiformis f. sp. tritici]|uniref:Uncharacterized protein n=3 Tax=Puccinia striiformis TaxID=27350 RepID=A0A0L0V1H3_9BASI|nr:hypothetical protein MJO28_003059 [Puccinia striiformis f. sp. tritici]KAI7965035.1 hypothetical protein MJO29_003133 [Puccinia striiformis f. sp. tritici]KAI9621786.1 hypothetical protein H4Q26_015552 [Puccinia striiformis f. sp. tritici PST-130]KNE93157.1 hypothetical protein PSTG_13475 [Puccinia striiformis f. sp. tritici PST-78]POV96830.1 hypothetical protein PSTT_15420 [Puccinia striiformis]